MPVGQAVCCWVLGGRGAWHTMPVGDVCLGLEAGCCHHLHAPHNVLAQHPQPHGHGDALQRWVQYTLPLPSTCGGVH